MKKVKNQRTPTNYAVTRRQKRYIVKQQMKQEGKTQINKHSYNHYTTKGGYTFTERLGSYFSEHWREYGCEGNGI